MALKTTHNVRSRRSTLPKKLLPITPQLHRRRNGLTYVKKDQSRVNQIVGKLGDLSMEKERRDNTKYVSTLTKKSQLPWAIKW